MSNTPDDAIWKRPKTPCYKCEDRVVGCHVNCDKYKKYQIAMQKDREMRRAYYEEKIEKS